MSLWGFRFVATDGLLRNSPLTFRTREQAELAARRYDGEVRELCKTTFSEDRMESLVDEMIRCANEELLSRGRG